MLIVLVLLVLLVAALAGNWFDTRMGSGKAARALRAKLHTPYGFHCVREENDGTIQLPDVDYYCVAIGHPGEDAYFIGTDRHKITGMQLIT